ncbi:MAG TPA: hypothetical protein VEX64_10435 [Pyrinomonadaceae bacterium]|jgi:hypothetical protein|nr:hypothetical protein [Pyrinomonadaceae bacterium]
MSSEGLITIYNPSLAALLVAAETQKGAPLTEREVIGIRDSATVVNVPAASALEMEKKRGYKDINPENCWEDWQSLRQRMK